MKQNNPAGVGFALDTGIGAALEVVMNQIAVGVAIGIAMGAAIGAGLNKIKKNLNSK